jgi:hypothetical protein
MVTYSRPDKPIVITFDDASGDLFEIAFPILTAQFHGDSLCHYG